MATLLSLAGIYSFGAYTSPVLLVPLWLAARSAGSAERWVWIGLAAPCAWITGWLLAYSAKSSDQISLVVTLSVIAVFAATAKRNRVAD